MNARIRELCPNCIDFTDVVEKIEIVREDEAYRVEKTVRFCQLCKHELTNTVTLKFKHT